MCFLLEMVDSMEFPGPSCSQGLIYTFGVFLRNIMGAAWRRAHVSPHGWIRHVFLRFWGCDTDDNPWQGFGIVFGDHQEVLQVNR